jgi:hypothetical protein
MLLNVCGNLQGPNGKSSTPRHTTSEDLDGVVFSQSIILSELII